jgi:hypothetical protein
MAMVLVRFDGGGVPVVTGDIPPDENTPLADPQPTGFSTNQPFMVAAGTYCFSLQAPCAPLWRVVQAVDGEQTDIDFRRAGP